MKLSAAIQAGFPDSVGITDRQAHDATIDRGQIAVVRLSDNLGYSGGNNVGLRIALNSGAGWVILLNNDCEVPPDLIDGLILSINGMARVGAIGCQLLTFEDPPKLLYGGGRRLYVLGAHWLTKWKKRGGRWRVNFVPFACVALSSEALNEIGLLDERYFAYVEDCDFCHRLKDDGWTMVVNLDVRVQHRVSASFGRRSPRYYYYIARNTPLFIGERLRTPWKVLSLICFVVQSLTLAVMLTIRGRIAEARALFAGWRDYLMKQTGAMPG